MRVSATDDPENQHVREKSRIDPDVRACEGENQRVRKIASEKNQSLSRARPDRDGGLAGSGMRVGISPVLYIFTTVFCLAKEMCMLP